MANTKNILFLGREDGLWYQLLVQAFESTAEFHHIKPEDLPSELLSIPYNLIVVNEMDLPEREISSTIRLLKAYQPQAHIVIVSPAPTWQAARAAFRAGAADYLPQAYNLQQVKAALEPFLHYQKRKSRIHEKS